MYSLLMNFMCVSEQFTREANVLTYWMYRKHTCRYPDLLHLINMWNWLMHKFLIKREMLLHVILYVKLVLLCEISDFTKKLNENLLCDSITCSFGNLVLYVVNMQFVSHMINSCLLFYVLPHSYKRKKNVLERQTDKFLHHCKTTLNEINHYQ